MLYVLDYRCCNEAKIMNFEKLNIKHKNLFLQFINLTKLFVSRNHIIKFLKNKIVTSYDLIFFANVL